MRKILPRQSIVNKVALVCVLSMLFTGAIILTIFIYLQYIEETVQGLYDESFQNVIELQKLNSDLEKTRRELLTLIVAYDRHHIDEQIEAVRSTMKTIDKDLAYFFNNVKAHDPETMEQLKKIRSLWDEFTEARENEIFPALLAGRLDYAATIVKEKQTARFNEFIETAQKLVVTEKQSVIAAVGEIRRQINTVVIVIAVLGFTVFLATIIYIIKIMNTLRSRLKTISDAHVKVGNGELDFQAEVIGLDEISWITEGVNSMINKLRTDKIEMEQAMEGLNFFADEQQKLNEELHAAQGELSAKNIELEKTVRELKELNEKLAETTGQMFQSEKLASIGQLAAGVAHEINNPLGYVSSNLSSLTSIVNELLAILTIDTDIHRAVFEGTLADSPAAFKRLEEFRKSVNIGTLIEDIKNIGSESKEGVDRIVEIVRALKEFSHTGEAEMQECDLNACLENTIKLCWHEIKYKAKVVRDFGAIPTVICNRQKMSQVFMNIIINAAHAVSDAGEISVRTFADGEDVVVKIRDNGTGMPLHVRQRIFEPFYTTKPVGQGTGLGLSIAYGIIREHKGSIAVESEEGRGTEFTITLPTGKSTRHAADNSQISERNLANGAHDPAR